MKPGFFSTRARSLPHFIFFCEKACLWFGSKGVMRKKHRREKKSIRRSTRASAGWGGPIWRPAGRPYNGLTIFLRKEGLARPAQEMKAASRGRVSSTWFLRRTPLLPDRAPP